MAKRLVAKVGEYTNGQGETKGRYVNVGAMMQSNDGGEFILLDPSVSLSGILVQQNAMAASKGQQVRDRAMISIYEDQPQQGGQQQGWGQPQQPQQPQQQAQQAPQQQYNQTPQGADTDIPF